MTQVKIPAVRPTKATKKPKPEHAYCIIDRVTREIITLGDSSKAIFKSRDFAYQTRKGNRSVMKCKITVTPLR